MTETITCIDCLTNDLVQLGFDQETLVSRSHTNSNTATTDLYVSPGLIDLQINGYAGVDFNTFPIEESSFLSVIDSLVKEGITSFFPTVITNSSNNIISLLKNIDQLCQRNPVIDRYVGGIHLEGPFISPEDETRGAHDSSYITAPDWDLFLEFRNASNDRIKIVTISAEWDNAPAFIEKCVRENIIVALGHTMASSEQIKAATDAGAKMSTHLGNGAPLMLPRNSNIIFDQLANDDLAASLIADGFHLPDSFLKVAIKMKQDRAILVSDSTMFAGMEAGIYDTHIGGRVVLEENKRLSTFKNRKLLAGAAVSLLDCIKYLLKSGISDLSQTWSMASINPIKLISNKNMDLIKPENPDLVLFEYKNGTITILNVIKNKKMVYSKSRKITNDLSHE